MRSSLLNWGFGVSVVIAASGCQGRVPGEPRYDAGGGNPGLDAGGTGDATDAQDQPDVAVSPDANRSACAAPASALCAESPTGQVATPTMDAFVAAIAHRWILCGTGSVFGNDGGDIGLEITTDGHWYKLYPAANGGVVRGAGFDQEGTWTAIGLGPVPIVFDAAPPLDAATSRDGAPPPDADSVDAVSDVLDAGYGVEAADVLDARPAIDASYGADDAGLAADADDMPPFQLNLSTFGSGALFAQPVLASSPEALRLDNEGIIGTYVVDPTVPAGDTQCKSSPSPGADAMVDATPGSCASPESALCSENPGGAVSTPTADAFVAALAQRWILCGNESVFTKDGGDVGIDFTADGHWYKLYPAANGGVVRGAGFDQEGTWSSPDEDAAAPTSQVNLEIFGGGGILAEVTFASTPQAIRLDNEGVDIGTYVVDPSVPVGDARCATPTDR